MSRVCELSGKSVMTGNNVSKANNRTRRRFLPNLQKSSMHSSVLGKTIQFRVATSTIRTVEKNGGIDSYLLKKAEVARNSGRNDVIKTWSRASMITPDFVGQTIAVHNGRQHIPVFIREDMVGQKLGEFSMTRTFKVHSGDRKVKAAV